MALQKVDTVIAGVGAIAVLATVLGVVFYEDLAGELDIEFPTSEQTMATHEDAANGETVEFALVRNATGASVEVVVEFSGQAGQGGDAQIVIEVEGPNGTVETCEETMTIAARASSASETYTCDLAWAEPPEPVTADPNSHDASLTWNEPLRVTVTIDQPDDNLGAIPGAVNYTFTSDVTPTVTVFAAQTETPDVETA